MRDVLSKYAGQLVTLGGRISNFGVHESVDGEKHLNICLEQIYVKDVREYVKVADHSWVRYGERAGRQFEKGEVLVVDGYVRHYIKGSGELDYGFRIKWETLRVLEGV